MQQRRRWNHIAVPIFTLFLSTSFIANPGPARAERRGLPAQEAPKHISGVCIYLSTEHPDTVKIGNGLVVNSWGYVLTPKHLLRGTTGVLAVRCHLGGTISSDHNVEFVDSSLTDDLAVFKVADFPFWEAECPPCVFGDDTTLFSLGTEIEVPAYRCLAQNLVPILLRGHIYSLRDDVMEIHCGAVVEEHLSGSPVVLRESNVIIGMVFGGTLTVSTETTGSHTSEEWLGQPGKGVVRIGGPLLAVPVNRIKRFLKNIRVRFSEEHWSGPSAGG